LDTHRNKSRRARTVLALAGVLALAAGGTGVATAGAATTAGSTAEAAAAPAAPAAHEGDIRGHRKILIVTYHTVKDCTVQANYPTNAGNHTWTVPNNTTIAWRFNVTGSVAAVSDTAHPNAFPHWGFVTDSSCIGTSVGQRSHYEVFHNGHWVKKPVSYPAGKAMPKRVLSGRSQFKPFWRAVDWHPSHGSVPSKHRKLGHDRTLRDAPHRFVIGNVFGAWQVRPTGSKKDGYTKVYVPSLHRWGWLQL
jgi:hypothetical protein